MHRKQTIEELRRYFGIEELACPHAVERLGNNAWDLFKTELLETLLAIRRDILAAPMTINDGVRFTQRGFRCNRCELVRTKGVPYLSSHCNGSAFDADCQGMTAEQARRAIIAAADKLPHNIRMEDGVNWLHVDVYDKGKKIYLFKG